MLKQLVEKSAGRIAVMAGCGVNASNVAKIVQQSGVQQVHLSGRIEQVYCCIQRIYPALGSGQQRQQRQQRQHKGNGKGCIVHSASIGGNVPSSATCVPHNATSQPPLCATRSGDASQPLHRSCLTILSSIPHSCTYCCQAPSINDRGAAKNLLCIPSRCIFFGKGCK